MKQILHRYAWTVGLLAAISPVLAQGFVSGSNGSYGPLNVTADTVTLDPPADGIFHCTTINVAAGATLKFNRNSLNTPIYLLATGVVAIDGTIDVSGEGAPFSSSAAGRGGPGGFDGGVRNTTPGVPSGAGRGPGGGRGGESDAIGAGSYGGRNPGLVGNGAVYGTPILIPLVGGSGGGGRDGNPVQSGGGGGGAVLIASSTSITLSGSGRIRSWGGRINFGDYNGGSGGAIRLVAPIVSGTGFLTVASGSSLAGHGRARIDAIDRSAMAISCDPTSAFSSGNLMLVFPQPASRLDVIHVAGTNIPENTGAPVQIQLPLGAPAEQTVRVQARDFGAAVPVRVVLTPESGDPVSYDATIDNTANNPATIDIPATFPVNTVVNVDVWTR